MEVNKPIQLDQLTDRIQAALATRDQALIEKIEAALTEKDQALVDTVKDQANEIQLLNKKIDILIEAIDQQQESKKKEGGSLLSRLFKSKG